MCEVTRLAEWPTQEGPRLEGVEERDGGMAEGVQVSGSTDARVWSAFQSPAQSDKRRQVASRSLQARLHSNR